MDTRTLKSVYKQINKEELKSEKIELNKVEDLLSSLRRSGEYDPFDELAQLN